MKITNCMYCDKKLKIHNKANSKTAKCVECHVLWHRFRNRYSKFGENTTVHDLVIWFINQDQKCFECGSTDKLTVDRINPGSRGGLYETDNLQILCYSCNCTKKRGFSSIEEAMSPVLTKVCTTCGIEKPLNLEYFHKSSYNPVYSNNPLSAYHGQCKECRLKRYSKEWADSHPKTRNTWKIKHWENYEGVNK